MAGLLSVWLGLIALLMSLAMLLHRPAFNDVLLLLDLYFACPLSLTFAGIVLWTTRRERRAYGSARTQAKVGAGLAVVAAAIVYLLVAFAVRVDVS